MDVVLSWPSVIALECVVAAVCFLVMASLLAAQNPSRAPVSTTPSAPVSDSVILRIVNTELRSAVQIMQQYLDRPVVFSGAASGPQVTLETPRPVARDDVPRLLRGLLESQGYELSDDSASGIYRARLKEQSPRTTPQQQPSQSVQAPSPQRSTAPELFVIPLSHARAADVATTINALFGRNGSATNAPTANARTATLSDELRTNQIPPVDTPLPQSVPGTAGRTAALTGELTIVADARANSLLVRANRADFELIRAAVQQIDVRPPQVLIEVLIVESRRDRSFSLGVDGSIPKQRIPNTENATASGSFTPGATGLAEFTLKVMGVGGWDLDATIRAAIGRGDVRIVSRPVVLTANDEEAEVVVGSQRPFVQVSRALPTDAALRDQVVQYKDVGTKLRVRPTISIDGTVQLNVVQEVSSATTETAFNAPVISTRSIRTDLLVRDGQTITLGGLTDKQRDVQSGGVPILSSIPILGGLFGRHARSTTETELFIFLTPRVIRTDEDAKRLTDPLRQRADKVSP